MNWSSEQAKIIIACIEGTGFYEIRGGPLREPTGFHAVDLPLIHEVSLMTRCQLLPPRTATVSVSDVLYRRESSGWLLPEPVGGAARNARIVSLLMF